MNLLFVILICLGITLTVIFLYIIKQKSPTVTYYVCLLRKYGTPMLPKLIRMRICQTRCRKVELDVPYTYCLDMYQFMKHISPKHHFEFIRYVKHGVIQEGGSFEQAAKTDMAYKAAIMAARLEIDKPK